MPTFLLRTPVTPIWLNAQDSFKGNASTNLHVLHLGPSDMDGWTFTDAAGVLSRNSASSALRVTCKIPLLARSATVYQQLTEVKIYHLKADTASTAIQLNLYALSGGVSSAIYSGTSTTSGAQTTTISSLTTGPNAATDLYLGVTLVSAAAADKIYGIKATFNNSLYIE
jgi:hypothetical protein